MGEHDDESTDPHLCHRCGATLTPGRGELYRVTIRAVADPYPPVFTAEDLAADPRAEMNRLIGQMSDLSEREASDQVARSLTIELCNACYLAWIEDPTG